MNSKMVAFVASLCMLALSACADLENAFGYAGQKPLTAEANARYGAIAYSQTTQRWHIRWNVVSPDRAVDLAVKHCGAADCRAILTFGPMQCGTFSLGNEGALGVGKGKSEPIARAAALGGCAKSGQNCKVAPAQCNN